jgi:hypothetical protein
MAKKQDRLIVVDSSATIDNPQRVHQIVHDGKVLDIVFNNKEGTLLPADQALKFNKEGFTVYESNGVTPYKAPIERTDAVMIHLEEGEVIARLEELSQEALYLRCILKQGGEVFEEESPVEDMVHFLKTGEVRAVAVKTPTTKPESNAKSAEDVSRTDKIDLLRKNGLKVNGNISNKKLDEKYTAFMSSGSTPASNGETQPDAGTDGEKPAAKAGHSDNGDMSPDTVDEMLKNLA